MTYYDDRPAWIEARYVPLARTRYGRRVLDVELPDSFITIPTRDGDVVVSGAAFDALRDSMIGAPFQVISQVG